MKGEEGGEHRLKGMRGESVCARKHSRVAMNTTKEKTRVRETQSARGQEEDEEREDKTRRK